MNSIRQWMTLCEADRYHFPMGNRFATTLSKETWKTVYNLYKILKQKYGEPVACGGTRLVFSSGRFVFKLPINDFGFSANNWEATRYKERHNHFPLAKCRIIVVKNIPIIVMEFVKPVDEMDKPEWADFVDCQQVGRNRAGDIVAYDYGN